MADKKTYALQVVVFDVGNNPITSKVQIEIEDAVATVLKKHTTLAHTVVTA